MVVSAPSVQDDSATEDDTEQTEEEQFSGQVSDKLDEFMEQIKQKTTEGPEICKKLAHYMTHHIELGFNTGELDYSVHYFFTQDSKITNPW